MTLKEKCKEYGFTLTDVAKETKISVDYLSKLNLGKKNNPSLDVVGKISKVLGVTLEEVRDSLKI